MIRPVLLALACWSVLGAISPAARPAESPAPPASPLADAPAAPKSPAPKGLAGVGLTPEDVNRAIDRGSEVLWKLIKADSLDGDRVELGSRDVHVLASLALVHAGAHRRFPEFDEALRTYLAKQEPHRRTYEDGLLCMLLESYGDATFLEQLQSTAQCLIEGQLETGLWCYVSPWIPEPGKEPDGRALRIAGGVPLDGSAPRADPLARKKPWQWLTSGDAQDADTSNTQYGTLGLRAASMAGIKISPEVWKRNLEGYRLRKVEGEGFRYTSHDSYGSMTCAGICGMAICLHELGEKRWAEDPAIRGGLDWMVRNFSVKENPGMPRDWHYYYLYSLERVGRVLDTEFIGPHEWYPLGARALIDLQGPDGSWVGAIGEDEPRRATSFALLFLTRATPSLSTQLKRGGSGTLKTAAAMPPRLRIYIILDASGSMLEELGGVQKFQAARDTVASLVERIPEGTEVALRVYGHRKRAIENGSSEDTELLIPLGKLDHRQFLSRLLKVSARGKTPLARSLLEARDDLRSLEGSGPVRVVLLTDGGEDTFPRQDPLQAATEFGAVKGVELSIVGFDINRPDWSEQLQEMARRARGRFLPAARREDLVRELRAAVLGCPEGFQVIDSKGVEAVRGEFGQSKTLPEGKYRLETKFAGKTFEEDLWINTGAVTAVTFDAARVGTESLPAAAAPRSPVARPAAGAPAAEKTPQPAPRFCAKCGERLKAEAKFCAGCGAKVAK